MDAGMLEFYHGKRVLVTGHTGFKGGWLCRMLQNAGAQVAGYALDPVANPSLFSLAEIGANMADNRGDIRDLARLQAVFEDFQPEIVFHLAAQPIVRQGYAQPVSTYETNVMGTVNVLECARNCKSVRSVLNVTTDKVYRNSEWAWGYRETDPLDGFDPYANSKSCSELVTSCYRNSFFSLPGSAALSTARAGNVIGGGDFAADRIIPDCVRAVQAGKLIELRNPNSVRPYQHVLEPLSVYLMIARAQLENPALAGCYNVGPEDRDCVTTGALAEMFVSAWGNGAVWKAITQNGPHEANYLKLDCSKLKAAFQWQPRFTIAQAVQLVCDWTKVWLSGGNVVREMDRQIAIYFEK
ncbi:MAG: CDP-glucose 4,6-dehydratase [Eubacteriales bacterium]|nr:CDP-glucose 4,6-dehydratase [Eubacteriales bacterium]